MTKHNATTQDLLVSHYYAGARHTVFELVERHGHVVEIDGNKSDGYALALRTGDFGVYAHSLPLRTFPTISAAKAACRNAFGVEPSRMRGLAYVNR